MTPREKATKFAVDIFNRMDPSGNNTRILLETLEPLTDAQFAQLMDEFQSGKERLSIYSPVFDDVNLDVDRNMEIGEELGYKWFQQVVYHSTDPETPSYVGRPELFTLEMPWRRTAQLLIEGVSVAKHNNSVDQRTGAVTGASAASKLSGPEQNVLFSMGMVNTIIELGSARGGDAGRWQAIEASMRRTGRASLKELENFSTGPESIRALSSLLTAQHISNSL